MIPQVMKESLSRRSLLAAGSLFGIPGLSLSAAVQNASSPYRRPKLKITDVRTAQVLAHGHQLHVRVYTDQGVIGLGEGTDAVQGGAALVRSFRRFLIGQDPLNVDYLFERIRTGGIFAGAQGGQYIAALTAVEIALWDIAGKALGLPIYQLLGGKMRDKIRVYCDSQTEDPKDPEAPQKLGMIKDMGFTAIKIDIDEANDPMRWDKVNWTASNGEIDNMIEKIRFVREFFPKRVDMAVDMHGRYDGTTGKRVAKEAEPFKLLWLEEPVPPENIDAMRDIRASTSTPICCGENLFLRHGFVELLHKRAVDIIMPDFQKCGGLLEARKISDMAHAYYVPVAPHCVVSPIGVMASAHVCAAIPNFLVLEWHWIQRMPLWRGFVKEGEIIEKGFITPTDRPGIGVEMNEEVARKAQIQGTPWFEEGM
jgi:galactonate dehydratase